MTIGPESEIRLETENGIVAAKVEYTKESAKFSIRNDSGIDDITYIESPLYLHILDLLANASPYHEMGSTRARARINLFRMVPLHIMDFANKMNIGMMGSDDNEHRNIVVADGGSFYYDAKRKTILFSQGEKEYFPLNVVSGIKIFGVLQILLDGGFLDVTKPLVWDEPENHLYPAWQVEFAKLLVQLSKSGIPVMITTHSSYFLQAIRYYAAKEKTEKYVNYYTSERTDKGLARMTEVTDSLEDVFRYLAEPLNKVINVDAVRDGIEM